MPSWTKKPRLIIVAPYFGNDLWDSWDWTQKHPEIAAGVSQELREAAAARERAHPLLQELAPMTDIGRPPSQAPMQASTGWTGGLSEWASTHVRLFALAHAVRTSLGGVSPLKAHDYDGAVRSMTDADRVFLRPVDAGGWRTILTAEYRGRVQDDRDPRIRVGLEVTRDVLRTFHTRCQAAGVNLLIAFTPTKENVLWARLDANDRYPALNRLVEDEERVKAELIADLDAHGVPHVDLLEALRSADEQPYYGSMDGHPNDVGHRAMAHALAAQAAALAGH